MHGKRDAKNNPRDYGIARNFGSGLRDWKTLLGTRFIQLSIQVSNSVTWTVYKNGVGKRNVKESKGVRVAKTAINNNNNNKEIWNEQAGEFTVYKWFIDIYLNL